MKRIRLAFFWLATLLLVGACGSDVSDSKSAAQSPAGTMQSIREATSTVAGAELPSLEPGERLLAAAPEGWKEAFASKAAKLSVVPRNPV